VRAILASVAVGETMRPEVLRPDEFVRLHRTLVDGGWRAR
jgi:hypothetical protein